MFMPKKNSGFSLVELLVSLALMLVLVGVAVTIFINSSNVLVSSEQRIAIYQNARAALDSISRDVSNASTGDGFNFFLRNPTDTTTPKTLLEFTSVASWINSSAQENQIITGKARSYYYVNKVGNNRWSLKRHLVDVKATAVPDPINVSGATTLANDVVCQFISEANNGGTNVPAITINYFFYDSGGGLVISTPEEIEFDKSAPEKNLPIAIRITMDLTDDQARAVRTVSQMIWLVNSDS